MQGQRFRELQKVAWSTSDLATTYLVAVLNIMPTIRRIITSGYFPRELPPPFITYPYAKHVFANPPTGAPFIYAPDKTPNFPSRPLQYNLARAGSLRRPLSIPNPINFYQIANFAAKSWTKLLKHYNKSAQALSKPRYYIIPPFRSFDFTRRFAEIPAERARLRPGMRYCLRTDIREFYPSLYTHAISWALHSKKVSQANPAYHALLGNQFDRLIQNGQQKQTKGIPIGPDTSFLAAEVVLTSIDRLIVKHIGDRYFRFIDDFEFCFKTFAEAESGLSIFQELLGTYELAVNEAKTKIEELPSALDQQWPRQIRSLALTGPERPRQQRTDLFDFFNATMDLWRQFPDQGVVAYAVKRTCGIVISPDAWNLYQRLLMQWALAEPAVLPIALDILSVYVNNEFTLDQSSLEELLALTIEVHAPRGHTSEVAWALWGHLLFKIPLGKKATSTICRMNNSVIALLALDARKKKLLHSAASVAGWAKQMEPQNLTTDAWLLAYEALLKKWLPSSTGKVYINTMDGFSTLGNAKVSFYDDTKSDGYTPKSYEFLNLSYALKADESY